MRMTIITVLLASLFGGALTLGLLADNGEEDDPCSDPNVDCSVRMWRPVG